MPGTVQYPWGRSPDLWNTCPKSSNATPQQFAPAMPPPKNPSNRSVRGCSRHTAARSSRAIPHGVSTRDIACNPCVNHRLPSGPCEIEFTN